MNLLDLLLAHRLKNNWSWATKCVWSARLVGTEQSPVSTAVKFARHRRSLSAVSLRHARSLATIEPRNQFCQLNGHHC